MRAVLEPKIVTKSVPGTKDQTVIERTCISYHGW